MRDKYINLVNFLISHKSTGLANALVSLTTSLADGRFTAARWKGGEWEFKYRGGSFYSTSPFARPKAIAKGENLFFNNYHPAAGDVILDIGAGGGTQVILFSNMVGPAGRVIAIEADPTAVRRLRKQVSSLPNRNVEILPIAVGEAEGFVSLSVVGGGDTANSIVADVGGGQVNVRCRPLSAVISELGVSKISYLKMNIEGAEVQALRGLGDEIARVQKMCVSCHDFTGVPAQRTYDEVEAYLSSKGLATYSPPPNPEAAWEDFYIFAEWPRA